MTTIDVRFDTGLFPAEAVTRAAHRYTDDYFVQIESGGADLLVRLTPKNGESGAPNVAEHLRNDVLDEQLRACVRKETSELHTALVSAAMRPVPAKPGREP